MTKARDLANAGTALTSVSATELGYLDGVTSAVQTQLDAKAVPANVVNNTLADAKGDLVVGTGADTFSRLAVGNNGETLVADSSTATGLRYQGSMAAGRNAIIGGSFDIWQRGTTFTSTNGLGIYGPDRWQIYSASTGRTYSRQAASLTGFQYCLRVQRDSGNTNTSTMQIIQNLESVNSIPFAGQTVTVSFWARGGANNSDTGLDVNLWSGTGTDQSILSGYTGQALVAGNVATVTTTWQRFSYTATVGSSATQLGLVINNSPTGTAGAADYWEITGVQLEIGSVATTFTRAGGTIQGELAACQRYYLRTSTGTGGSVLGNGYTATTSVAYTSVQFPVVMRVTPTATDFVDLRIEDQTGSAIGISAVTLSNPSAFMARVAVTISGATSGRFCQLQTGSTSGYIGFTAEL